MSYKGKPRPCMICGRVKVGFRPNKSAVCPLCRGKVGKKYGNGRFWDNKRKVWRIV